MSDFVDRMFVVDDASRDGTVAAARDARDPLARREVDYAKANRLFTGQEWNVIPRPPLPRERVAQLDEEDRLRLHVADSQSGYTVISLEMLECSTSTGSTR
jgi:hypothetical protein